MPLAETVTFQYPGWVAKNHPVLLTVPFQHQTLGPARVFDISKPFMSTNEGFILQFPTLNLHSIRENKFMRITCYYFYNF